MLGLQVALQPEPEPETSITSGDLAMSRIALVTLLCTLTGCQWFEPPAPPEPARCAAAVSGADAQPGPALAQLRAAQAKLRTDSSVADDWVAAGHAWVRLARVQSQPGLYAQAQDCATSALERSPQDPGALRLRGMALLDAHQFSAARALALDLLARQPDDTLAWGMLSDAQLELGHVTEATDAAQQMLNRKPSLLSYGRAAHLRWLSGDRDGAKQLYQAAIAAGRQQPDREPRAWMTVQAAWVFWHEGDYKGAAAGFDLVLRQLPDYAPALEGRGRTALALADYPGAIRWLGRALALHPLAETAWALGDAYSLAGDRRAADAAYARVLREAGQHDPRTLALFYATQAREPAEAVRLAERAYSERQDGYSKDALAFALFRSGELTRASRLSREVLALGVPDARLLYHAGLIARARGDAAVGGELIDRALRLNPRFDPLLTGDAHATITAQL
jgi:tetratricopeptide (TPR) repeat protein